MRSQDGQGSRLLGEGEPREDIEESEQGDHEQHDGGDQEPRTPAPALGRAEQRPRRWGAPRPSLARAAISLISPLPRGRTQSRAKSRSGSVTLLRIHAASPPPHRLPTASPPPPHRLPTATANHPALDARYNVDREAE
jgi:hypothetical protein